MTPTAGTRPTPQHTGAVPAHSFLSAPWIVTYLGAGLLALIMSLHMTAANTATDLVDAGELVRWSLPIAQTVHNFAMALTIGALVFALAIIPRNPPASGTVGSKSRSEPWRLHGFVLNLGAASGALWTVAALAVLVFSYAEASGRPVGAGPNYAAELVNYVSALDAGRQLAVTAMVAATVSTLCFGVRSVPALAGTFLLSLVGVVDMALAGHSASGRDHAGAVNSLGLHLLGVILWCGGLMVLVFISREVAIADAAAGSLKKPAGSAVAVLRRYSVLAGAGFVLVFFSGVINAGVRMSSWVDFGTAYGALVLAKLGLTVCLGGIGALHRLRLIPRLETGKIGAGRALWTAIAVELFLMGAAAGLGVSLSRTVPPVPETLAAETDAARIITWYEMPPEASVSSWFTLWRWDWLWVTLVLALGWVYLRALVSIRAHGGTWPVRRSLSWLLGLGVLTYLSCGAPAVYARVLFSAHVLEHTALATLAPLLLVYGAPDRLLLAASRGEAARLRRLLHPGYLKVVKIAAHPVVAGLGCAGALAAAYFTPLFEVLLNYHVGREVATVYCVLAGCVFVVSVAGSGRPDDYATRLGVLMAAPVYYTLVGVSLLNSRVLLAPEWFGALGRTWGLAPLEDQHVGGVILWVLGQGSALLLAAVVAVRWVKADKARTGTNTR